MDCPVAYAAGASVETGAIMKKNPYAEMQQDAFANPLSEESAGGSVDMRLPAEELPDNLENLCREHICPTCPIKAEADDTRLRSLAEMDNFKRRMQRDLEEQSKYAAEGVLADLLPGLDSLDLAIRYADKEKDAGLLQGVIMTRKLLLESLKKHGLEPVGEEAEAFNHELHEAVGEEAREDMPEMHVSSLLQRGYKLKDRLLRPAKVMVSRSPS